MPKQKEPSTNTEVGDIETDGLNPSVVWVAAFKNLSSNEFFVFERPDLNPEPLLEHLKNVGRLVFHNGIAFDGPNLVRLVPGLSLDHIPIHDTLVLSRLFNYGVVGGHSLEAWGQRLGCRKLEHHDWTKLTPEMVDRCKSDVEITSRLYTKLLPWLDREAWKSAIDTEHQVAEICHDMEAGGFPFDIDKARALTFSIEEEFNRLNKTIQDSFKPRPTPIREYTPALTKLGTISKSSVPRNWADLTTVEPLAPFTTFEYQAFNPASPHQIVERLNEFGWKPFEKTKGHQLALRAHKKDKERLERFKVYGWQISEANLATLPDTAPEGARALSRWLILADRLSTLKEWTEAYRPATGSIHGRFMPIGAWTGRMSHNSPNTANVVSNSGEYGHEMRALWRVPKGHAQVGVDADGIQLRVLAHLINDERFTNGIVNGDKALGTDPHSLNKQALGAVCKDRDVAKTFIYAWLLGAGFGKIASILGCSFMEAKQASSDFLNFYPGLLELKSKQIPRDAARGYFVGLDKRVVVCDNTHLMLAGYLQNGESVVMKMANILWRQCLREAGIWFKQLNFVHDEWQTECLSDEADYVAKVQCDSIRTIGEILDLNCPLAGSGKIGNNWAECH